MLDALDGINGSRLRLWLADDGGVRVGYGRAPDWTPAIPRAGGAAVTPEGPRWFEPFPDITGLWLETESADHAPDPKAAAILEVLEQVARSEREVGRLSQELTTRYEEIDLLYTISEILGHTVRLDVAAQTIVRAVSSVVGARRASIAVYDEKAGILRTVAAQGLPPGRSGVIALDDATSVAAQVFREQRARIVDPTDEGAPHDSAFPERGYQGVAYMSVPICYAAPGAAPRCVGVVNLTDRIGGDRFLPADQKLVAAVANQIGAALENARLVEREREQQRLQRELELAHQLQQNLLPDVGVLQGDAQVGVRCESLESVGGDFYTFNRLGSGRVGVMVGDVSSHGYSAALIMALVLATAGIHASGALAPDQALAALRDSLAAKLTLADSYLTVFYGILDPVKGRLTYANAGHPHAFRLPQEGPPIRLDATAPPLGLAPAHTIAAASIAWTPGEDLLCLWTDGLVDATNAADEPFGEARLLEALAERRHQHPETIVAEIMALADEFAPAPRDDRTLLVMRV